MAKGRATASVLSERVSPDERELLSAAAWQSRTSISDFVRRAAIQAAEMEVLNRTTVTIPAESWEACEAWVGRPAESMPELVELFRRKPQGDQ